MAMRPKKRDCVSKTQTNNPKFFPKAGEKKRDCNHPKKERTFKTEITGQTKPGMKLKKSRKKKHSR